MENFRDLDHCIDECLALGRKLTRRRTKTWGKYRANLCAEYVEDFIATKLVNHVLKGEDNMGRLYNYMHRLAYWGVAEFLRVHNTGKRKFNLDMIYGEFCNDEEESLEHPIDESDNPFENAIESELEQTLAKCVSRLKGEQKKVIKMRLKGDPSNLPGRSKQSTRHVYNAALETLRNSKELYLLYDFLEG